MPTYKGDKGESHFSMNPQVGKAKFGSGTGSPKKEGSKPEAKTEKPAENNSAHGSSVTLHDHGDGTFHSDHGDGNAVEHPSLGHALMHLANHHAPSGKHIHVHSEGGLHTAHTVDDSGNPDGPHDHQNIEELKNHMDQFLDEEAHEGGEGQGGEYEAESGDQGGDSTGLSHLMA